MLQARSSPLSIFYAAIQATMTSWYAGLEQKGLYFEGVVTEKRLNEVLELHRRSTVSTFGTRRSCQTAAPTDKVPSDENVSSTALISYSISVFNIVYFLMYIGLSQHQHCQHSLHILLAVHNWGHKS